MMFGLLASCLFLLCLALHVRVSHVSLSMCLITFYPSPLCDDMLCFLCARFACFVPPCLAFFALFASLHLCLYVHACVFVCLFVSSSLVPTYNLMQVHTCRHSILHP